MSTREYQTPSRLSFGSEPCLSTARERGGSSGRRLIEVAQKHGGRFERIYWTVEPYETVLEIGSVGNVRSITLRAYDRQEISGIIPSLRARHRDLSNRFSSTLDPRFIGPKS